MSQHFSSPNPSRQNKCFPALLELFPILEKYFRVSEKLFFLSVNKFLKWTSTVESAAIDMRYFARSKFSRSLVHKKNFSLILYDKQISSQDTYFVKKGRITPLSLNEFGEILQATIMFFNKCFFIGQNSKNVVHMTYSFLKLLIFF